MDKCTARVRVRDAHKDDVKDTTIKYKKIKIKRKRKYMSTVYGDVPKPKSNLDLCTNPRWCARPRLDGARSALFTIFACSLLH